MKLLYGLIGVAVLVLAGLAIFMERPETPLTVSSTAAIKTPTPATTIAKPPYTIRGVLTLIDSNLRNPGSSGCEGQGGYSDVRRGKQVTITDATGRVIGVGELRTGQAGTTSQGQNVVCHFDFEVTGIPETDFYGIELQRRGTLRYSLAEIKQKDWMVGFVLSSH